MITKTEPCFNCGEEYPECDHHKDGVCVDCFFAITLDRYKEILTKRVELGLLSAEDAFEEYQEAVERGDMK